MFSLFCFIELYGITLVANIMGITLVANFILKTDIKQHLLLYCCNYKMNLLNNFFYPLEIASCISRVLLTIFIGIYTQSSWNCCSFVLHTPRILLSITPIHPRCSCFFLGLFCLPEIDVNTWKLLFVVWDINDMC